MQSFKEKFRTDFFIRIGFQPFFPPLVVTFVRARCSSGHGQIETSFRWFTRTAAKPTNLRSLSSKHFARMTGLPVSSLVWGAAGLLTKRKGEEWFVVGNKLSAAVKANRTRLKPAEV